MARVVFVDIGALVCVRSRKRKFADGKVVRLLLDAGANPNGPCAVRGQRALILTSQYTTEETVRMILDAGADVHHFWDGRSALHAASCRSDSGGVARLLLNSGAVLEHPKMHESALHEACRSGIEETVRILLKHGASVEWSRPRRVLYQPNKYISQPEIPPPLFTGCDRKNGSVGIATALLEHGASVSYVTATDQNTALHLEARKGHVDDNGERGGCGGWK